LVEYNKSYLHPKPNNYCLTASTEAEFIAINSAVSEIRWLKELIHEMFGIDIANINIYTDSTAAISIASSIRYHARTKHMSIKLNSIREWITNGLVKMNYIESHNNIADLLTKALSKEQHTLLTLQILNANGK
jgi:hypothetical protein